MENSVLTEKKATVEQVRLFKSLFAEAGLTPSSARLRRFKNISVGNASLEIQRLRENVQELAFQKYEALPGMATGKQIVYWRSLRTRLGESHSLEEMERLKTLSTSELNAIIRALMRELQDKNDDNGVPLPQWRLHRGLYDSEQLRAGQRAAAERQATKRAETAARISARQTARPLRQRDRPAYPGE